MALLTKFGSILKQSVSQNSAMFNSVRYMASKLYIGGLSYETDDKSLGEAFSQYGDVAEAKVIMDRNTGNSRGFGFVTFADPDSANSAITGMDGQELGGRNIRVSIANERPPRSDGFASGGGGGY